VPNLTIRVGHDMPPVVDLLFGPTEARVEAFREAGEPVPLPVVAAAMLDTGASETYVTRELAERVGAEPGGERTVRGLGAGPATGTVYRLRVYFGGVPAVVLASSVPAIAVERLEEFGVEAIVGRELLSRCLLLYNGPQSTCNFAF
jgi:predicted aspartyl protease